jgi:hypothetical protein
MGDEVGKVIAFGHFAGIRRGGIQADQHDSRAKLRLDLVRDLANQTIRHGQNDRLRAVQRFVQADYFDPTLGEGLYPAFADLDVTNLINGIL